MNEKSAFPKMWDFFNVTYLAGRIPKCKILRKMDKFLSLQALHKIIISSELYSFVVFVCFGWGWTFFFFQY